jgi:hypothetical protein
MFERAAATAGWRVGYVDLDDAADHDDLFWFHFKASYKQRRQVEISSFGAHRPFSRPADITAGKV